MFGALDLALLGGCQQCDLYSFIGALVLLPPALVAGAIVGGVLAVVLGRD